MSDRLSQVKTAAALRISPKMLRKYIDAGKISAAGDDGLHDVEQATREYFENTDPAKRTQSRASMGVAPKLAREGAAKKVAAQKTQSASADGSSDGSGGIRDKNGKPVTYNALRTRHEFSKLQTSELKYRTAKGLLISRAEVENTARMAGQVLRDKLLALPDRLVPYVSREDMPEIKQLVRDLAVELVGSMKKIADDGQEDL
jgi:hypothetical protein